MNHLGRNSRPVGGVLIFAAILTLGMTALTTDVFAGSIVELEPVADAPPQCCQNMPGIPHWMFLFGGAFLLLGTFGVTGVRRTGFWLPKHEQRISLDLLRAKWVRRLVARPWFPLLIQMPFVLLFGLVIVSGMFGSTYTNFAPVFTWTIWWGLLVFVVLLFGKGFCMVCPWDAIAGVVQRGSLFRNRQPVRTLNKKWPGWAANIYPATALFIGLTWLELGFGVTRHAQATAVLGLLMLALVVGSAVVFERRAFCRYGCLIGRISGLYAMFAPVELRAKKSRVCQSCAGKDCSAGNQLAMACPTFEMPAEMTRSTYCTLCTECVRACPHHNIALRVRPFGEDLNNESAFRADESHLAIILLALTSFHGLTMTPTWYTYTDWVQGALGIGYRGAFTLLMALCIAVPIAAFWGIAEVANRLTRIEQGTGKVFRAFAFPLIPIALFYHVAHNVMHFFREAQYLVPRLSDPFGWGWNLFGTARQTYDPLLSLSTIWYLQLALVLIGHLYGIFVSERIARKLYDNKRDVWLVQLPMFAVMIAFSMYSLWLIHQPMEMRTGL